MNALRSLTLVWPGLPWLWLRGSRSGLVLALAFGITVDIAVLTTFIWPELFRAEFTIAVWTAAIAIWLAATASAACGFPPPLPRVRPGAVDELFAQARDAYLARDWLTAETHLHALLAIAPTDGEAQLLWGTLLRRVGRLAEAREALAKLSRSDSGARWQAQVARELALLDGGKSRTVAEDGPATLPLAAETPAARSATGRNAAA